MKTISEITGEEHYNNFLNCWLKEYCFIQGEENKFISLFSEKDFRELLAMSYHHIRYPEIRLVKNGDTLDENSITSLITTKTYGAIKKVSPEKVWHNFNLGATIVIQAVNSLNKRLFELNNSLTKEFNCYVQINSYYTPPNVNGLDIHYDTHDVILLQIYGKKEWSLASQTFINPLAENHFSKVSPPTDFPHRILVSPGDMLYIPRGMWHYSKTTSQPSLHLTIGVHCRNYIDILNSAIDFLKEDFNIRASLPINFEDSKVIEDIIKAVYPILKTHF
jgi:ribosomal protein L16 Arg81 hydroxylase